MSKYEFRTPGMHAGSRGFDIRHLPFDIRNSPWSFVMRILMLAHRIPYPPNKGEKIRAFHHLRFLAQRHQVTLLCVSDDPDDLAHVAALRAVAEDVEAVPIAPAWAKLTSLVAIAAGGPMSARYFFVRSLRERVLSLVASRAYDLVFVYSSAMARYVEDVCGIPIVIDFVDMDSQKWEQYAQHRPFPPSILYRIEAERMRAFERRVSQLATANILVSEAEAALFRRIAPGAPAFVVPMVVDTDYFLPPTDRSSNGGPTLIFTGVMDYFPNVDAVEYFTTAVYPRIRRRLPRARLLIVGQRPARRVRRLAKIDGVEVTGAVPDVRPYFARAHVSVAPLRVAQGMQAKILEAMAMGAPVVASRRAFEGIEAEPGADLFVEDDPDRFADRVIELLRDPDLCMRTGRRARTFVESHHSWQASLPKLESLLLEVVNSGTFERSNIRTESRPGGRSCNNGGPANVEHVNLECRTDECRISSRD
jgi:sugar transferase (PEP-CTERM/EpsH1 system associated)